MLRVLFPGRDSSLGTYIILTIPENINLFFNFIVGHGKNLRETNDLLYKHGFETLGSLK